MAAARQLRVSLAQFTPISGDVRFNLAQMRSLLDAGARDRAELICFPELCLPGYLLDPAGYAPDVMNDLSCAEQSLLRAAHNHDVQVIYGTARLRAGRLHNVVVATERDGTRTVYAKAHMVSAERAIFAAGQELVLTADGDLGLGCCYDLAFPGFCAGLADAGARVLTFPMAWEQQRAFVFEGIVVARAIENVAYVVCANHAGVDATRRFHGGSKIVDPMGNTLVEMGSTVGVSTADLDLDWVTRLRSSVDSATYPLLADRLPQMPLRHGSGSLGARPGYGGG